jgi:hypothetical protein
MEIQWFFTVSTFSNLFIAHVRVKTRPPIFMLAHNNPRNYGP